MNLVVRISRSSIFIFLSAGLILSGCSDSKSKKGFDTSFVQLGKPGELKTSNNTESSSHIHNLLDSDVRFIAVDDFGTIKAEGSGIKGKSLKVNDSVIGYFNKDKSKPFNLVVVEVIDESPQAVTFKSRLGNFSDLSKESKVFKFTYDYTPKFVDKKSSSESLAAVTEVGTTYKEIPAENIFSGEQLAATGQGESTVGLRDTHSSLESRVYFQESDNSFNIQNSVLAEIAWKKDVPLSEITSRLGSGIQVTGLPDASSGGNVKAIVNKAKVSVQPTFRGSYEFSWGAPQMVNTQFDAILSYSVDVTINSTTSIEVNVVKEIFPMIRIPILIPGPVPVMVEVEIEIPMGVQLKASGSGSMNYKVSGRYALHALVDYTKDNGFNYSQKRDSAIDSKELTWSKGVKQTYSAEVYMEPHLRTRFYRVLAPYAYAHPYFKGQVKYPLEKDDHELFAGIIGGVGLQVVEPLFDTEIYNYKKDGLFEWSTSWDIISASTKADKNFLADFNVNEINVNERQDEGFVRINLLPPSKDSSFQFQIQDYPKYGVLQLANDFALSGEAYYFPLATKVNHSKDLFKVKISDGLRTKEVDVKINVSPEIISENQKPRFAVGSRSMKVAMDGPDGYRGNVPVFGLFGPAYRVARAETTVEEEQPPSAGSDSIVDQISPHSIAQRLDFFRSEEFLNDIAEKGVKSKFLSNDYWFYRWEKETLLPRGNYGAYDYASLLPTGFLEDLEQWIRAHDLFQPKNQKDNDNAKKAAQRLEEEKISFRKDLKELFTKVYFRCPKGKGWTIECLEKSKDLEVVPFSLVFNYYHPYQGPKNLSKEQIRQNSPFKSRQYHMQWTPTFYYGIKGPNTYFVPSLPERFRNSQDKAYIFTSNFLYPMLSTLLKDYSIGSIVKTLNLEIDSASEYMEFGNDGTQIDSGVKTKDDRDSFEEALKKKKLQESKPEFN